MHLHRAMEKAKTALPRILRKQQYWALEATGHQCPKEAWPQASRGYQDYRTGESEEAVEAGQQSDGQEAGSGE